LQHKLVQRDANPDLLEQVLDQLQRDGLQSDERFTESFIQSRFNKGQGPVRIRQELKERGIGTELIDRYMEIYQGEWRDLLRQVHDTKFGSEPVEDNKALAKRARFLEYRGFPGEMIRSFLLD
jgi:regulatory protein